MNWITLSLATACLFSLRNMIIGGMTTLGFDGLYFFSTGSALMSTSFFLYRKEWARLNNPLDINVREKTKVIARTWGNRFDYSSVALCLLAGFWQMLFYYSVVLAARASRLSGLNFGITTAIWSFIPFFVAIVERILYAVGIKPYQLLGILMIVFMSILVSLSDLFGKESAKSVVVVGQYMPMYKAVLYSLIFPVVATAMTFIIKFANKTMRISSQDFAMSFQFIYSWVFLIVGIYQWSTHRVEFSWPHLIQGLIVGFCTSTGACVACKALTIEGIPAGPVIAVMNSQIIINLIADCIIQ